MDDKAVIVLNSKYGNRQYRMYRNEIIVKENGENINISIRLPQVDRVIEFYDMYYVNGEIAVIVATSGSYDIRYVLDEDKLMLTNEQLSK